MKIEQIYTGCLAQGAYYIESDGEAAIIDPLRETQPFTDLAKSRHSKIKYIFETHFHADFVSGHHTLSKKTNAPIIYGPSANPEFEAIIAQDGQEFSLGKVKIKVLHTPGHTLESSCYLVIDENGKEHAVFTGDTLFLGDVGRPDLAQKTNEITQEDLAGMLFESLKSKLAPLPNSTIVYPGHGAGSACGKNMSKETVGTIGGQKQNNYAFNESLTKEKFITSVTEGLLPPPAYFPLNVMLNKKGYEDIETIINKGKNALSPEDFETISNQTGAVILDVRHQTDFVKHHIPKSIFIGIDGGFAPWVGALIKDIKQPILLVAPEDKLIETITRLSRVGFDNVLGYLSGGIASWIKNGKEIDTIKSISNKEFEKEFKTSNTSIFDVRKKKEYESQHLLNAANAPLSYLNDFLGDFETEKNNFIHCQGGYRSVIASSILKLRGIHNIVNIEGGFNKLKETNLPLSNFVCPTEIK